MRRLITIGRRAALLALGGLSLAGQSGCGGAAPKGPTRPQGYALIVGVNHYPSEAIPDLKGAVHDAQNMAALLVDRYGFPKDHVKVITDAEATRAGILTAFRRHLVEQATPGAEVVFHFSGHGGQVFDRSGDEPDRWDETLVPYDARRRGDAAGDILDDELQGLVQAIVARGAHPTVILDSCHSGTAVRAAPGVRGLPPAGPQQPPPPSGVEAASMDLPEGYTLISAAGSAERAHEIIDSQGRSHGGLTWFLTQALRQSPDLTWRGAVARAASGLMVHFPDQRPRLEGVGLDDLPFAPLTDGLSRAHTFIVRHTPDAEGGYTVDGGHLHGLTPGTLLSLRDLEGPLEETQDEGHLLLTEVGLATSAGRLTGRKAPPPCGEICRAVELSRPLTALPLPVHLDGDGPAAQQIAAAVKPWSQIQLTEGEAPATVKVAGGDLTVQLPARGGAVTVSSAVEAVKALLRWARWHHLMQIPDGGELPVEIALSPAITAEAVPPGTRVDLVVENQSSRRVWLSVLSLSDDGAISLVYPAPGAEEYIDARRRWAKAIRLALPPRRQESTDVLKVIATNSPLELAALEQPPELSPPGTRGQPNLQGWLVWGATRGGPITLAAADWASVTLPLTVRAESPPLPSMVRPAEAPVAPVPR